MGPELIGRQHPAAVLRAEVVRAAESHGGLVLVTGEAGIGKTSLVTRAAEEAREHGALVIGGSCWDSHSAPGYWPWTQILRALRRAATPGEWAAAARESGGCLAALLGEGGAWPGGPLPTGDLDVASDAEADSFRLHDTVTGALVAVSQSRPLVVVLDDLHWADSASLRLLEFAAQHTWFERLLLIGTYRDVEVETPGHPLRPLVLPLLSRATTLTLTGLGPEETAALMERTTGVAPDAALAAEVHERTGGNPFFVEQTARLWHSGGSVTTVAPGVRDALRRRLSLLPEPVASLLSTASVLGHAFHRQWLAAVEGEPVPQVDRLLEQAVAARLVVAEGAGRFSFAHDLVRETLYEELGTEEAGRLHARAVRAADRSTALAAHVLPTELARHGYLAAEELEAARAVALLEAAATDAAERFAYDEAVGHRRRALERGEHGDPRKRVVLGLKLAEELHHRGHVDEAWQVFEETVERARALDDAVLLARAALSLYRLYRDGTTPGTALMDGLMHEAHARLDPREPDAGSEQRVLLDQLAQELSARLAALARDDSDDEFLSFGLWARHDTIWGPGTAAEREGLTREISAVAHRTGDPLAETVATSLRWVALLEQGDPRYLDQFRAMAALAKRSGQRRCELMVDTDRCVLAIHRGRFAQAEELLAGITRDHQRSPLAHSFVLRLLRWQILLTQGRFEELAELHDELAEEAETHTYPPSRLLEALTGIRRGDPGGIRTATAYVEQTLADGEEFTGGLRAMWLRLLAQTAVATGSPELVQHAAEALEPVREEWAVSFFGCDIGGPMSLWIAHLDAARERWDDAVDAYAEARRSADLLRLRVWSLEARNGLAAALVGRGAPEDIVRAATLAEQVEREATALGIRHLVTAADRLRARTAAHLPRTSLPDVGLEADAAAGSVVDTGPASAPDAPSAAGGPAPTVRGAHAGAARASAVAVRRNHSAPALLDGRAPHSARPHDPDPGPAPGRGSLQEFRREGAVWRLRYDGRTVHMPDTKGLRDLHVLLGLPGTDVPAPRLLNPEGGAEIAAAHAMGGDPVLDEEAKVSYKRRLEALDVEIDRASARGDADRVAEFDRERDALLGELRAAAGLAGRSRRLGDEAERARKTVTARIRDTLSKLDGRHPELAAHLRGSVSTGAACRYQPADPVTWRL